MIALIDKLEKMIEGDKLSRDSLVTLIAQMREEQSMNNQDVEDMAEDLKEAKKEADDSEKTASDLEMENESLSLKVLDHSNLVEQQILDEFKDRYAEVKKGSLHPNEILKNFKVI